MSRSGYSDDYDESINIWRASVQRAINGKRGQSFLREMLHALDAMPAKRLIDNDLIRDGEVCAIGAVGRLRGYHMEDLDPEQYFQIAERFNIARALVQEIEDLNDDGSGLHETPESRWERMRAWVSAQIREPQPAEVAGRVEE